MTGRIALGLALAVLAGCGEGGERQAPVRHIAVANPMHDQLQALSELNRGLALRRAIQDSRHRCKKIDALAFQQDYKALKMWTARCSDTGDYAIFLAAGGDVQVRTCRDVATLGLPACRLPATPPGGTRAGPPTPQE